MKFSWFKEHKPTYIVCPECRVHFEPEDHIVAFGSYCPAHRKPLVEKEQRKNKVANWAIAHMELVERLMAKEERKRKKNPSQGTMQGAEAYLRGMDSAYLRDMDSARRQSQFASSPQWFGAGGGGF